MFGDTQAAGGVYRRATATTTQALSQRVAL
jgi:hypothetical protein